MGDEIRYEDLPAQSREAVHAARDAAQAVEMSRQVQVQNIGDIMQSRMEHVLARGTEQDKSIILARVPYICQDIKGINISLAEIKEMIAKAKAEQEARDAKNDEKYINKDQFSPVKAIVYGLVGLVLTGFGAAVWNLVIHHA